MNKRKTLYDGSGGMGGNGPGVGPYNPVTEQNIGHKYFKAVQKDLEKRYGKKMNKKNPAENRGNKENKVAS